MERDHRRNDEDGGTALHSAARYGHKDVVALLEKWALEKEGTASK